jgi:L1 cell adhesion molecule like protein
MVQEAEKYKDIDAAERSRVEARMALESYAYGLRNSLQEEKLKDKIEAKDRETVESAIQQQLKWIEESQQATKEEYESRQKELEAIANPIMMKVYQAAGGAPGAGMGGMGGMPDFSQGNPTSGPHADASGPTIEEVD